MDGAGARATYTVPEAADVLGISRSYAYELARCGEFPVPVIRLGRALRVSRRALHAYIDGASPTDEGDDR